MALIAWYGARLVKKNKVMKMESANKSVEENCKKGDCNCHNGKEGCCNENGCKKGDCNCHNGKEG